MTGKRDSIVLMIQPYFLPTKGFLFPTWSKQQ